MAPPRLRALTLGVALAAALAGGCGRKGPPVAPGLRLPAAPGKVSLAAPDGALTLSWEAPRKDRDGQPLKGLSGYRILRGAWGPGEAPCATCPEALSPVATLDSVERRARGLPETAWVDDSVSPGWTYRYQVEALGRSGKPGALSAAVQIRWLPVPAPEASAVSGDAEARIHIQPPRWPEGLKPIGVRVYGPKGEILASEGPDAREVAVRGLANGVTQDLSVRLAARTPEGWEVESPGTRVTVRPENTMPPLPPEDLVALQTPEGIQLRWLPARGEPYARALVRRAEGDQELQDLAELPGTDVGYLDRAVEPGHTYRYAIVAVDAAGNQSIPTREVQATFR